MLESIQLPSTIRIIDSSNFADTPSLKSITVHPDNEIFYTVDGVLYGYTPDDNGERHIHWDAITDLKTAPQLSDFVPDADHPSGHFYTHIDDNGIKRPGYIANEDGTFTGDASTEHQYIGEGDNEAIIYSIKYPRYERKLYFVPRNTSKIFSVLPGTDIIGGFSFAECDSIEKIVVSHNLSSIEDSAFISLDSIRDFDFADSSRFHFDEENKVLYSVGETTDAKGDVLRTMNIITALPSISGHYVIPDTHAVVYINNDAFSGCAKLTEITIPLNVESIGAGAFNGCIALEKVNLPENVTSIAARRINDGWEYLGYAAFENTGIRSIDIPYGVKSIPDYCFTDCRRLKSINIPATVTSVYYGAFHYCTSLEEIVLPDTVNTSYGTDNSELELFMGCISLRKVTLPRNMAFDTIGKRFFAGCTKLESVVIPENIKLIDEEAFLGTALTEINTRSVGVIGANAFSNCTSLTSAKLPNVIEIHDEAFSNCTSLERVEFSENISEISESAFSGSSFTP